MAPSGCGASAEGTRNRREHHRQEPEVVLTVSSFCTWVVKRGLLPANPVDKLDEMGEPEYLSHLQVEQLEAISRLVKEPLRWKFERHTIQLDVDVPPYAVAAIL
jgi:hypothetical protein